MRLFLTMRIPLPAGWLTHLPESLCKIRPRLISVSGHSCFRVLNLYSGVAPSKRPTLLRLAPVIFPFAQTVCSIPQVLLLSSPTSFSPH
jgi:hypothetical protein